MVSKRGVEVKNQINMNPEPAQPNDDWYHDDCPTCRQLKATGIVMQAHDDDEPEAISVTITYSLALQAITGKAMERVAQLVC